MSGRTPLEFIVANRAPDPPDAILPFLARPDVFPYARSMRTIRLPEHIAAISTAAVRARPGRGEPVTGLAPSEILPLLVP